MKFLDVKIKLAKNSLIDIRNVINLFGKIDRRRLYEWQKMGYIKKLTNNYYIFTDAEMNDDFLRMIANKIYAPSYVGLESALSYYCLIPEAVFEITSVTSKKTKAIETTISHFVYKSVHKRLFWGYTLNAKDTHPFYISDPEKTILDYLYLNPHLDNIPAIEEVRFNREEFLKIITVARLKKYLNIFCHKRLSKSFQKLTEALNVKL